MKKRVSPAGFTLVELLVVIFIIGLLVALLLPAIQAARESARRVQCKNHLKQLALAAITHEAQIGHFPSNGWGSRWVGDADRGFGRDQPGSWAFNVLPFLEESSIRDLAGDGSPNVVTDKQRRGAGEVIATPIPIINCPSRRPATVYPHEILDRDVVNAQMPELCAKLDYAINSGDVAVNCGMPSTLELAASYSCPFDTVGNPIGAGVHHEDHERSELTGGLVRSGVSFARSEVRLRHVTDGASKTYLIGEKNVPLEAYFDAPKDIPNNGDKASWLTGNRFSTFRQVRYVDDPLPDNARRWGDPSAFGSAHSAGFHMAFCDGSVRLLSYEIDIFAHMAGGNRLDGTIDGLGGGYR